MKLNLIDNNCVGLVLHNDEVQIQDFCIPKVKWINDLVHSLGRGQCVPEDCISFVNVTDLRGCLLGGLVANAMACLMEARHSL